MRVGRAKKYKMAEQKINKKCKMAEQNNARSSKKRQDGRAKVRNKIIGRAEKCKMVEHKLKKCQMFGQKFARCSGKKCKRFLFWVQRHCRFTEFLSRATFLKTVLRFGRFSAKEVQKHHTNMSTKKPCQKLFSKFDKAFSSQFFTRLFFLRLRVFLSDGSSKTLRKMVGKNIRVEKVLHKTDQKSKTDFLSTFW
jgi:hypothetical protein